MIYCQSEIMYLSLFFAIYNRGLINDFMTVYIHVNCQDIVSENKADYLCTAITEKDK